MIPRKLEEIRSSDKATKLRWLIICSAASLIVVVGIWLISMRVIIATIETPAPVENKAPSTEGFFASIKNAWGELRGRTSEAIGNVKDGLGKKEIQLIPATSTE